MAKGLKTIKYIVIGILFVAYVSLVILVSTLVLNRNQFGYTRFGNKDLLLIDKESASEEYKDGMLVIAEKRNISELTAGQKVFVYKTNAKKNEVKLEYATIAEIVDNEVTSYITIESDKTSWGDEYIAGVAVKSYNAIGKILLLLQSKWIFFFVLVVPIFFILLYEIYLFIISIKYGDIETMIAKGDEEKEKVKIEVSKTKNETNDDIEQLEDEEVEQLEDGAPDDKNDEIERLKREIEELKKKL